MFVHTSHAPHEVAVARANVHDKRQTNVPYDLIYIAFTIFEYIRLPYFVLLCYSARQRHIEPFELVTIVEYTSHVYRHTHVQSEHALHEFALHVRVSRIVLLLRHDVISIDSFT